MKANAIAILECGHAEMKDRVPLHLKMETTELSAEPTEFSSAFRCNDTRRRQCIEIQPMSPDVPLRGFVSQCRRQAAWELIV